LRSEPFHSRRKELEVHDAHAANSAAEAALPIERCPAAGKGERLVEPIGGGSLTAGSATRYG